MILIAGASATADRRDVVPVAIEAAGGRITHLGMPVEPGNLLALGESSTGHPVICMPGCARSPAVNGFDSQSGCNTFRAAVAPLARDGRFFDEVVETGRHEFSMRMVAEGAADVCAVDCVTHALLSDTMAEAVAGTRVLAVTPHAPNLPYVTPVGRSEEEVRAMQMALLEAAEDPGTAAARARLRLAGFAVLPQRVYERIEAMERQAADMGYPELA